MMPKHSLSHLETELDTLRAAALDMMQLVQSQLQKGKKALLDHDKELALEIMHNEKRVNGFELLIDNHCENIIACFGPVAVDLRFVLATLKINFHLERIGDNAEGISRNVIDLDKKMNAELLESLELERAFDIAVDMLQNVMDAYRSEDSAEARKIFEMDKHMDRIQKEAFEKIAEFLPTHPECTMDGLNLFLIHRKLERIGDLMKNLAEEVIFYVEAKVLKHQYKVAKAG